MRGGLSFYHGDPAGAAAYVEADRSRAEDRSLADGTGLARRFAAAGDGPVRELAPLTAATYETWVAGRDPDDGEPKGRVRHHPRAVRFVEVTINGPKSWSLAAVLHPDIAAAYDAAQDRAASQVIGWLSQHATTRVGPRLAVVHLPVERLEAVTVRHYTSRAGDPHRHLHLQINARVLATGEWRGLHTVGVRDSLAAINGIGHAAVVTDPQFRTALAAHGFSLDEAGEIVQLAPYVRAFSRRAGQIQANLEGYEADWSATRPGEQAGRGLRRRWRARAWADGRPDKVNAQSVAELHRRWLQQLADLGYRDRDEPIELARSSVGSLDRGLAVNEVLARLGAARSAWNEADVRGEVEQLIAREGPVIPAFARGELAEDLTARAIASCAQPRDRSKGQAPARVLTWQPVPAVEHRLIQKEVARGRHREYHPYRDELGGRQKVSAALARRLSGQHTHYAPDHSVEIGR